MASLLPTLQGLEEDGLVIFAGLWSLAYVRRTPTHSSLRAWLGLIHVAWCGTGHAARRGGRFNGFEALTFEACAQNMSLCFSCNISNNTKAWLAVPPCPLPLCPCAAYSPGGVSSGHTPSSSSPAADQAAF